MFKYFGYKYPKSLKGAIYLEAFFTKVVDFLKLGTKHLLTIFLITGLALFLPKEITNSVQLTSIIEEYRSWIGGVFLVSGSISVINEAKKREVAQTHS
ncbi:super-infection exclusion protein B [Paenibacillus sp. NPDC057886]|uniref:super-infection exclusion protein B n=1 Tax=Paenibacillus sp. NPDC057886 TaxID=3346270 RepID=UPI0036CE2D12